MQNQRLLFNLHDSDPKLGPDQSVCPWTFSRPCGIQTFPQKNLSNIETSYGIYGNIPERCHNTGIWTSKEGVFKNKTTMESTNLGLCWTTGSNYDFFCKFFLFHSYSFFDSNFVKRIHGVFNAIGDDPEAVWTDSDFDSIVDNSFNSNENFHFEIILANARQMAHVLAELVIPENCCAAQCGVMKKKNSWNVITRVSQFVFLLTQPTPTLWVLPVFASSPIQVSRTFSSTGYY